MGNGAIAPFCPDASYGPGTPGVNITCLNCVHATHDSPSFTLLNRVSLEIELAMLLVLLYKNSLNRVFLSVLGAPSIY